jgi:hypothetical protein
MIQNLLPVYSMFLLLAIISIDHGSLLQVVAWRWKITLPFDIRHKPFCTVTNPNLTIPLNYIQLPLLHGVLANFAMSLRYFWLMARVAEKAWLDLCVVVCLCITHHSFWSMRIAFSTIFFGGGGTPAKPYKSLGELIQQLVSSCYEQSSTVN